MTRFLLAVLVLANIASAIGVVYARHRHRVLFDEVTRLERARDELNVEFGRLQLEQAGAVFQFARGEAAARLQAGDHLVGGLPGAGVVRFVVVEEGVDEGHQRPGVGQPAAELAAGAARLGRCRDRAGVPSRCRAPSRTDRRAAGL